MSDSAFQPIICTRCGVRTVVHAFEGEGFTVLTCTPCGDNLMLELAVLETKAGGDGAEGYARWRVEAGLPPKTMPAEEGAPE